MSKLKNSIEANQTESYSSDKSSPRSKLSFTLDISSPPLTQVPATDSKPKSLSTLRDDPSTISPMSEHSNPLSRSIFDNSLWQPSRRHDNSETSSLHQQITKLHKNYYCGIPLFTLPNAASFLTLLIGTAITVVVYVFLRSNERSQQMTITIELCEDRAYGIQTEFRGAFSIMRSVQALFITYGPNNITEDIFQTFITFLFTHQSWKLSHISWAPHITNRTVWESEHNVTISQFAPGDSSIIPDEANRTIFFPVSLCYPPPCLGYGFNLASDPARWASINTTLATSNATIAKSVGLLSQKGQPGIASFFPVYSNSTFPAFLNSSMIQNWSPDDVEGILSGTFSIDDVFPVALSKFTDDIIYVNITADNESLYTNIPNYNNTFWHNSVITVHSAISIIDNNVWDIECFANVSYSDYPNIIVGIIMGISVLLSILAHIFAQRWQSQRYVSTVNEVKLDRQQRQAEAVLRAINDPIVVFDRHGRVLDANMAAQELFNSPSGEKINGQKIRHLFSDIHGNTVFHNNLAEPGLHEVLVKRVKTGEFFEAQANFSVLTSAVNNPDHVIQVVCFRDISAQKKAAKELQEAKAAAERLNDEKSYFLAFLCHELRNPLHVVLGMTDLLKSESLDRTQKNYVSAIIISGKQMLSIVNDVLDISRLKAGRMELEKIPFDIRVLIEEMERTSKMYLAKKQLEFRCEVDPRLPRYLIGDRLRVYQVLLNLIGNSIKFTKHGYIELKIEVVDLDTERRTGHFMFSLTDTGIGISPSELPNMFKEFSQANITIGRTFGGSGLGLSIVYNLVKLMNGEVKAESVQNQGTTVRFTIPMEIAHDFDTVERRTSQQSNDSVIPPIEMGFGVKQLDELIFTDAGMDLERTCTNSPNQPQNTLSSVSVAGKVLLVEDNLLIQKLAIKMLQAENFHVEVANNGKEAVDKLSENPSWFDVVLMDLQMPVMSGIEAFEEIKRRNYTVPCIAVTANALDSDRVSCMSRGFAHFVTKPYKRNLIDVIKQVIARSQWPSLKVEKEENLRENVGDEID